MKNNENQRFTIDQIYYPYAAVLTLASLVGVYSADFLHNIESVPALVATTYLALNYWESIEQNRAEPDIDEVN